MDLIFPPYNFKLKTEEDVNYVFDIIRKKWVIVTPEEWIRQHIIHYLIIEMKYPASLISVERGLEMNGLKKRFDVLVYNRNGIPFLLVECKRPDVNLSQQVMEQVAIYNAVFKTKLLWITNGIEERIVKYNNDRSGYVWIDKLPAYSID
jgi:hypothetical protein